MAASLLILLAAAAPVMRSWNNAALPPQALAYAKTALALAAGLLALARLLIRRRPAILPREFAVFFAGWAAWTVLATVHAADAPLSLAYLPWTAAGVAAFAAGRQLSAEQKGRLLAVVLATGGALGALVLLQYAMVAHHWAPGWARYLIEPRTQAYFSSTLTPTAAARYRPSGTMFQPNAMGLYFALLIPFGLALLAARPLTGRRRLGLAAALLAMTCGLWATDSRAAALLVTVAVTYLALQAGYRWLLGLAAVVVAAGAISLSIGPKHAALAEALRDKARVEAGLSGRRMIWTNAWSLGQERPLLGWGPGNFNQQYVAHFGHFLPNDETEANDRLWAMMTLGERIVENFHAHNLYLQLLGELGFAGPAFFLIGTGLVWKRARQESALRPTGSVRRALALAAAAEAVGLIAYGFFDSQLSFTVGGLNLVAAPLLAISVP